VDPVNPVNPDPVNPMKPVEPIIPVTLENQFTLVNQTISVNEEIATQTAKDIVKLPKTGESGMTSSLFGGLILTVTSAILLRKRK
ncbi:LPXTG cell wall anchor domain-containing protein, partial [Listeria monocytogenes]|nr:LPXTG cell wall anchor domain-containing protein [Listeria monocytogenes]EII7493768.1 LPXTG cell wall anchor domain-containing protein [Listeria monocytogenes]EIT3587820.1 LPXTG cell wall anchor domain-containing protein [Listeria monocytogenes]HAA4145850.1 cell surface protein [Listeria monocytogenes]